jgi:hypothetical protein
LLFNAGPTASPFGVGHCFGYRGAPMWSHERYQRRSVPGRAAIARAVLALLSIAGSVAAADNASPAPTLKVSGKASFVTEARTATEGFEVRATLSDEVGRPLPGSEVRIRASFADGTATLHRCGDPRGEAAGELLMSTDKSGRVCITVTGMSSGTVELTYQDARGYLERASRVVRLPESVASSFEVGFDPPLTTLSLDQPVQELGLVARAQGGAAAPGAAELVLSMATDGSERELGRAALDGLGEVHRLSLVSSSFGEPGPARLIGRLRARDGEELAAASVAVMRVATVALNIDSGGAGGIEAGQALQVKAASALGPAPSGVVEARSRGLSVAVARIQNGIGTLNLPAAPGTLLGSSITLEYVGEGAGWLSGPPVELRVLPAAPGYGRYALWFAAAALAALAVVLGWRRPPRPRPHATTLPPRVRASVEVLETFATGGGYRGFVRDAHDGSIIAPAAVSFVGSGSSGPVLLQVRTSNEGAFHVETSFPSGTMVEVSAPYHATLTAPLPPPGVIELSLVSRRRALLDRLVRWAERRGKPWMRQSGDPTPAHVAVIASSEAEPNVERWARGLEQLAFGPNPPDAASEQAAGVTEDPKLGRD